jgi:1-acyl-sn-glycerol-3-phosphate acyltransferase
MQPMKKLSWYVYRVARAVVRRLFPEPQITGLENLPADRPCIIVGNHAQAYGPIYMELYLPGSRAIWCIAEMMHVKEVPDYAFRDFWSRKPLWCRWVYRLLSFVVAPLVPCVLNNAHTIGVYRDSRIINTMRESLKRMKEGTNIVIFPEHEVFRNGIVWEFQEGFVNLARLYTRQTGEGVDFVPMYVAPRLRRVCLGSPIAYDPTADPGAEARRICDALMDAVTDLALALPPHVAVPYPNLPKHSYISTDSMKGAPAVK